MYTGVTVICLFNVQCVHCRLREIKKQQFSELSLTLYHTEKVASLGNAVLRDDKIIY